MEGEDSLIALAPNVVEKFGPVWSILSFGNSAVVDTSEGLVMIDCGAMHAASGIFKIIRKVTDKPLHTVIYTHGHVDHIAVNYMPWENSKTGDDCACGYRVIAQENIVARFDRYRRTNGYNSHINRRQFQIPQEDFRFFNDFRYPDRTYREFLRFCVGGETFELFAAKGETDDATIIWMPEHRFCFCGDFMIWNAPNAGNPQKAQRFPEEWAQAARFIVDLRPLIVFPGHGPPIIGEDRCMQVFRDQAELLEGICAHALAGINSGLPMGRIMMSVSLPAQLLQKPYMRARYDDPRWFVATLWRRYCGWYTQDVRHLLPCDISAVGKALARLAGGANVVTAFARKLVTEGGESSLGVALEFAELAAACFAKENTGVDGISQRRMIEAHQVRAEILRALQRRESSLMAKSIYRSAAVDSERVVDNFEKARL